MAFVRKHPGSTMVIFCEIYAGDLEMLNAHSHGGTFQRWIDSKQQRLDLRVKKPDRAWMRSRTPFQPLA
jgi:hypothetical protein